MRTTESLSEHLTIATLLEEHLLRDAWPLVGGPLDVSLDWARPAGDVLANGSDLSRTVVVGDAGAGAGQLSPASLDDLHRRGAAFVLVREPSPEAWSGARAEMPVYGFRATASIDAVVRLVAGLALAHDAHVLHYASRVHAELATLLHRGAGVEAICQQLERITACGVAFLDSTRTLAAVARDQHPWLDSSTAGSVARLVTAQTENTRVAALVGHQHPVHEQVVPAKDVLAHVLYAPVTVADRSEGWLVLIGANDEPSAHEVAQRTIALQQAVGLVGTEVLRVRSVERAEERARGNFVHALLHGRFTNKADLAARAAHRSFPIDRRFGVVVVQAQGLIAENDSPQRLANMARTAVRLRGTEERAALSAVVGDIVGVIREVPPAGSSRDRGTAELAAYAAALHRRLSAETDRRLLVTYGRPVDGAMQIKDSYREGRIALSLAAQFNTDGPVGFADMRTYATLLDLALNEAGRRYAADLLTPLREASGDLEAAVSTYIASRGNLTHASRELNVHRNTMLYKLDRASKALGQDLRDPETQFDLWLAMKLDLLAETADAAARSVESG